MEEIKKLLINITKELSGVKEEISDIKTEIVDMKLDISNMKSDISNIKLDIKKLNEKVDKVVDNQDIFESAVLNEFSLINKRFDDEMEDLKYTNTILAQEDLKIKTDIAKVRNSISLIRGNN